MAPTITLDTPSDGATVSLPLVAQATVAPPGAIFALWDDTTGMFLGAVQSDGTGHAQLVVNSLLAPGPRWHQSESSSFGSGVAISVGVSLESFTGLSVALSAAQAGIAAGVKGAALAQSVAAAVATWKAGAGATGISATRAQAQVAATMTATIPLAQATGLSATVSSGAVTATMVIGDRILEPAASATVSSPVTFTGTAGTGTGATAELWDEA